jgi:hypothetical protein
MSLAVGADDGQGYVMAFTDLFGGAVGDVRGAAGVAALASGCFGVGLGWSFVEGSGLSFAGAKGFLQPPVPFGVWRIELGDAPEQGPTVGTGRFFPTVSLSTEGAIRCAFPATGALNQYLMDYRRDVASLYYGKGS